MWMLELSWIRSIVAHETSVRRIARGDWQSSVPPVMTSLRRIPATSGHSMHWWPLHRQRCLHLARRGTRRWHRDIPRIVCRARRRIVGRRLVRIADRCLLHIHGWRHAPGLLRLYWLWLPVLASYRTCTAFFQRVQFLRRGALSSEKRRTARVDWDHLYIFQGFRWYVLIGLCRRILVRHQQHPKHAVACR